MLITSQTVILTPVAHRIEPECERALRALETLGHTVWRVYGHAAIDVARSEMASRALKAGFEHLMWIDADVAFDPSAVDKLREQGKPLLAGVYPKKAERALSCQVLPGTRELKFGRSGGVTEILYSAAGFLYTHRSVYDRIQSACRLPACNKHLGESFAPYFLPMVVAEGNESRYLAEDYAFCHRAKTAGIPILVDTTIRLYHLGQYPYGWEDAGESKSRSGTFTLQTTQTTPAAPRASELDPRGRRDAEKAGNSAPLFPIREDLD